MNQITHQDVSITSLDPDLETVTSTWHFLMAIPPVRWFTEGFYRMYLFFMWAPMAYLYFYGPSVGGYAFWAGKSVDDICHTLTNVDSHFWRSSQENMVECHNIAMKSFQSFMVGVQMMLYIIFMFAMLSCVLRTVRNGTAAAYSSVHHHMFHPQKRSRFHSSPLRSSPNRNSPTRSSPNRSSPTRSSPTKRSFQHLNRSLTRSSEQERGVNAFAPSPPRIRKH